MKYIFNKDTMDDPFNVHLFYIYNFSSYTFILSFITILKLIPLFYIVLFC